MLLNPAKFDTLPKWHGYLSRPDKWGPDKPTADLTPSEGASFDFDLFFDRFASMDKATRIDWGDYFTEKATFVGLRDPDRQAWRVIEGKIVRLSGARLALHDSANTATPVKGKTKNSLAQKGSLAQMRPLGQPLD